MTAYRDRREPGPGAGRAVHRRPAARGVVVVTERLEPYEEAERLALIVSLVTGVLATGGGGDRGLGHPARAASGRRDGRDRRRVERARPRSRFDLGPPDNEISALAGTLDQLLDKVSSAIRSEQRLTSELAHELRTPLTTIQGMADLMLLRDILPPEAGAT